MANLNIETDGTITGTKLSVDGKEVTKKEKVVSISMYASAPFKSKFSGEVIPGQAVVSYEIVGEDSKIERKTYGTTETAFSAGIGQKIQSEDSVIRFIGVEIDKEVSDLVDRIINHCKEANIQCPTREILLSRSVASLKDKVEDLGLKSEGSK